jgi:hypothetical protein
MARPAVALAATLWIIGCRSAGVPVDIGRVEVSRPGSSFAPVSGIRDEAQAFLDAYEARVQPLMRLLTRLRWI